jgi:Putative esterase
MRAASALRALVLFAVILLILSAQAASATAPSDDFNRPDGSLGSSWVAMSDGPLSIASQAVIGTSGTVGDIRIAETYNSDQSSQIELTPTQLSGEQWVGSAVRAQNGGQKTYLGIYFWNNGSPQLRLYKRNPGWSQLGSSYNSGPLPAGTKLQVSAVGSTISFLQDGVTRITVTDTSISGGAPGIMTYGQARADNWVGASATADSGSTYSVGGSTSGLSGTVVLRNNGGDDLTVTANGSFAFATKLAGGAAYEVTVKTNPSGQSCSVANGTGTIAAADVTNVTVSCNDTGQTGSAGSDDFNRPDGSLGSSWVAMSDGPLSIASQAVIGTSGTVGDIRIAETYNSDQSSQIELTPTQLSGEQWVGSAVRAQNGGQKTYLGIYFWNNGSPQLRLYKRNPGWSQLGSSYNSGPLPAGTKLQVSAVGSTISFLQDGVTRITVTDTSISGGAPGIMTYGQARADNWVGAGATSGTGNNGFSATYRSTDANGVAWYDVTSADNGYGTQTLRVLAPTHPAAGVPHSFLYVLPVEAGLGTTYGDGIATLEALDAQNQYNLTIIEPSFAIEPWYADNPNDPNLHYDTFMTKDLVPWVTQNLSTTGHEQNWLIGFSKSGIGGQDLLFNHPDVFTLAASWDFPADMSTYDQFSGSSAGQYGTDANFQTNYRLTPIFLEAHKLPFISSNRIWIGGYQSYQTDMSHYDALLNSAGIPHATETPTSMPHRWDSGWVQIALAALSQDSQTLTTSP